MDGFTHNSESIVVIGNYLPRKCGLATFTHDLCEALARELSSLEKVIAVAMDDIESGYKYPDRVKFEIREGVQADYLRAAEFLNVNQIDVAILQHEYGIFGGQSGAHVFHLLDNLRMPIITTLHTVLSRPAADQKAVIVELGNLSERLTVMTHKGKELLEAVYSIPENKITVIPHGIPDVPFVDSCYYKDQFGLERRKVILTFGLLGPDKGIEYMIDAMPEIVKKHPDAIYVVLGATHPHIVKSMGEKYRHGLQQRIQRLGLEKHVMFFNRFLDLQTLIQFLTTADVYVTPYLKKEQIVSGTLSYAMGAGKVVVSTPYWHAEEMLQDDRGILVPFKDADALSKAVIDLLSNDIKRNRMRKSAYQYCRSMIWKEVARSYITLINQCMEAQLEKPKPYILKLKPQKLDAIPEVNLNHLFVMTDDTGILQHACFSIPNPDHGYCLDDNARALIAASMNYHCQKNSQMMPLIIRYLSFMTHAFNEKNFRFRNFLSYDRRWLEEAGSEDAHGRALLALGYALRTITDVSVREMTFHLFIKGIRAVESFEAARPYAFTLIGIHHYLKVFAGDATVRKLRRTLSEKLHLAFKDNGSEKWPWLEDILTYANARLPHALILTGYDLQDKEMLDTGFRSLKWLLEIQTAAEGHLSIIGNDGWMRRDGERARFAQQPIEVMGLIEACADAFRITKNRQWLRDARRCFDWFMGKNDLNIPVYDFKTGGCHDGLESYGLNENMGAESTLSWLISLFTMYEMFGQEVLIKKEEKEESEVVLPAKETIYA
ncbi:MAG: glycosyltransferase family 4 protein [Deltaproteobacteria bacterium]|nr:glycosyltransferase family 4 protein [Deltaproteobacteria bacterium]MBW2152519.1 glycosyltransferase family 4 protein [Deltaproteobacteria bacterium]